MSTQLFNFRVFLYFWYLKNDGNFVIAEKDEVFGRKFDFSLVLQREYSVSKRRRATEQTMNNIRNSICQF